MAAIVPLIYVHFWETVCKTVRPMLSHRCLSVCPVCPVCDVRALWPNGWTDQDETWHAGSSPPWPHCFRWGPSSPSPKGRSPPIFGSYMLRPNGCMDQDATWYGARLQPRRLCPSPKFSADVYYSYCFLPYSCEEAIYLRPDSVLVF